MPVYIYSGIGQAVIIYALVIWADLWYGFWIGGHKNLMDVNKVEFELKGGSGELTVRLLILIEAELRILLKHQIASNPDLMDEMNRALKAFSQ